MANGAAAPLAHGTPAGLMGRMPLPRREEMIGGTPIPRREGMIGRMPIPRRGGFTLIELLVVIAIIVLLMAILLAAVYGAKKAAKNQEATALLAGLSTDITQYIQDWGDCPGPFAESDVAAASGQWSGNQNLYLGLSKRWALTTGNPSPALVQPYVTFGVNGKGVRAETGAMSQPYDQTGKPYGPYFNAKSNQTAMPADMGMTSLDKFPMIVDTYSDPLPILYYRKTAGVDNATGSSQASVTLAAPSGSSVAPYYLNSNAAITTNLSLRSPSGVLYPQSLQLSDLDKMLSVPVGAAQSSSVGQVELPKGRFVLISAGYDRTYAPAADGTTDNIIVAGGN